MGTIAYLECPTGLAGDMCLGALVHLGVPLDYLATQLDRLGISAEYELAAETVHRNGIAATKLHVRLTSATAQAQEDAALIAEGELPDPATASQADSADSAAAGTQARSQSWTSTHTHGVTTTGAGHSHSHRLPAPLAEQATSETLGTAPAAHAHHHAHHAHHHAHVSSPSLAAPEHHVHAPTRKLPDIEALIQAADLPPRAAAWSLAVFRQLAIAEAAVHGTTPDQVHFHEVGATDAIVDIVGTCLGLDWLGIEALYCGPMPTGGGVVHAAHGTMPVPTPAVLKLWELRQVPVFSNGIQRELVTPTGAAIATAIATGFGDPPAMTIQAVGLGAGSRQLPIPNMVRLWLGQPTGGIPRSSRQESAPADHSHPHPPSSPLASPEQATTEDAATPTQVTMLETQVDDVSPQVIGYLYDRLFEAGAVEVFTQAIMMKKSRPGHLITVICPRDRQSDCEQVLFSETTTLGIRCTPQTRTILPRQFQPVTTPYGTISMKLATTPDGQHILKAHPEFEDCAQAARRHQVPLRTVQQAAIAALSLPAAVSSVE